MVWALRVLVVGLVFLVFDSIWLTSMIDILYRREIGVLLAPEFRLGPAILFYLIYVSGITYFALKPALAAQSARFALLHGAAFGFVAYATYDLTNQATLKTWSSFLSVVDMSWGTFATGMTTLISFLICQKIPRLR
jgi:uncharacterized membrane protein